MLEGFGEDADDLRYAIWTSRERHGPRSTCGRPAVGVIPKVSRNWTSSMRRRENERWEILFFFWWKSDVLGSEG